MSCTMPFTSATASAFCVPPSPRAACLQAAARSCGVRATYCTPRARTALSGAPGQRRHIALARPLTAPQQHLADLVAVRVVDEHVTVARREQNVLRGRAPLEVLQGQAELLAPHPRAIDLANDDGAVLVRNADARAVGRPLHGGDHATLAVVDHLLDPRALVARPHDDVARLIGGRELAVLRIPGAERHSVPLGLVAAKCGCRDAGLAIAARLYADELHEAAGRTAAQCAALLIPRDAADDCTLGHGDLFAAGHTSNLEDTLERPTPAPGERGHTDAAQTHHAAV